MTHQSYLWTFLLCEVFILSGVQKANCSVAVQNLQSASRRPKLLRSLHHHTYIASDAVKPRSSVKGKDAPYNFDSFPGGNSHLSSAPVQREHSRVAASAVQGAALSNIREQVKLVPSFQGHHAYRVNAPAAVQFGSVQSGSISNLLPSGFNLPQRGSTLGSVGHAGAPYGHGSAQRGNIPPSRGTQAPSAVRRPTNPFASGQSASSSASSGYSTVNFAARYLTRTPGESAQRNHGLAQGERTRYSSSSHAVNLATGSAPGGVFPKPVQSGISSADIRYVNPAQSGRIPLSSTQRVSAADRYFSSVNRRTFSRPSSPSSAFGGSTLSRLDSGSSASNQATTHQGFPSYAFGSSVVRPSKGYGGVTPGTTASRYYGSSASNQATTYQGLPSYAFGSSLVRPSKGYDGAAPGTTASRYYGSSARNQATTYQGFPSYAFGSNVVRPSKGYNDVTPGGTASRYYSTVSSLGPAIFSGLGTTRVKPNTGYVNPIWSGSASSSHGSVKGGSAPKKPRPTSSRYGYSNLAAFNSYASSSSRYGPGFARREAPPEALH